MARFTVLLFLPMSLVDAMIGGLMRMPIERLGVAVAFVWVADATPLAAPALPAFGADRRERKREKRKRRAYYLWRII